MVRGRNDIFAFNRNVLDERPDWRVRTTTQYTKPVTEKSVDAKSMEALIRTLLPVHGGQNPTRGWVREKPSWIKEGRLHRTKRQQYLAAARYFSPLGRIVRQRYLLRPRRRHSQW